MFTFFIHVILKSHLITCCVKNTLFTFYSKHTCSFFMNIISMYLPILYMSIPIYKYIHMYIGKYIPPDGSEDPSKIFFGQILGTFFLEKKCFYFDVDIPKFLVKNCPKNSQSGNIPIEIIRNVPMSFLIKRQGHPMGYGM